MTAKEIRIKYYGNNDSRSYDEDELKLMTDFAKDYHAKQLILHNASQQRELLIAFVEAWDKDEINVYNPPNEIADEFLAIYSA